MSKQNKKGIVLCIIIPVIACIIFSVFCMLNLSGPIWFDESYSAYLTRGNFGDIWQLTSLDVHPPFYYFLLKIWSMIFGYTDVSMRFMSIFFGALTIIFLFHLLKRWFGTKSASVATLLISVSPMFIRYGQEMRMYTLVFFIVVLATYVLDLALETKKNRYYILYAILIALGMWTHYFTAIAWIAHIIYYTITKRAKLFEKKMLLTYIFAVLLFVPWMPSLFKQIVEVQKGFWIPAISMSTPIDYLSQSLMYSEAEYATGWLTLLGLGTVILSSVSIFRLYKTYSKTERSKFWLLLSLVAIPPVVLIVLSLPPLASMFIDRYILYSASLTWALIGLGVAYIFTNPAKSTHFNIFVKILFVICVVGCAITGIVNVENRQPEGFIKETILSVQLLSDSNIPILVDNEWNYYDAVFYSTNEHPIYGVDDWIDYQYGSIMPIDHIGYNLIRDIDAFVSDNPSIWYITSLNDDTRHGNLDKDILKDNYRIKTFFADEHLVAFELVRE